jgi:hypothetical protein
MQNSLNFNDILLNPLRGPNCKILILLLFVHYNVFGQTSSGSNIGITGDFLGWQPGATGPSDDLELGHENPNQPVIFSIAGIERARAQEGTLSIGLTSNQNAAINVFQTTGNYGTYATNYYSAQSSTTTSLWSRPRGGAFRSIAIDTYTGDALGNLDYSLYAQANGQFNNFAVFGSSNPSSSPSSWAGYFVGQIIVNGFTQVSDIQLKENISPIQNASNLLNSVNPVSYNFIPDNSLSLTTELQYGFIAQEVLEIIPELVKFSILPNFDYDGDSEGGDGSPLYTVNYIGFIPLLVQGIKEQNMQFEGFENETANLLEEINSLIQEYEDTTNFQELGQ